MIALLLALLAPAEATEVGPVDCASLPARIDKALCVGDSPTVIRASHGDRTVYVGQDVKDERPSDGPYLVETVAWIDGPLRGVDADTKLYAWLVGLGPVADRADAVARLRLFAYMRLGLDGAWPIDQEPTSCGYPGLPSELCGTTLVDTVYTATVLHNDDMSCECSTTWSKTIRDQLRLSADGTLDATETQVWCTAWPASASDQACGAGWKNPKAPKGPKGPP